jgi:ABC-type transporter Mla subunit MlaD
LIPKNSHVQINRVVKNIGPAISGKIVTSTHQESERLADFINKQQKLQDKFLKIDDEIKKTIENTNSSSMLYNDLIQPITVSIPSTNSSSQDLKKDLSPNESLYADLLNDDDNTSNSSFQALSNDILLNKISDISPNKSSYKDLKEIKPPTELLCPFEDFEKKERHLMSNAVIAPCCGYFICCEKCNFLT